MLTTMKKTLIFATILSLGLATSCRSKDDSPKPKPGTEQPQKPDEPNQPKPPTPPAGKKPSDYHIATRMTVKVNENKQVELLRTLKIEELAWGGEKGAITLADLLPFVTFSSSETDGTPYTLTADDLKLLELVDMRYQEGAGGSDHLTFKIRYNGVAGKETLSIPISRRDYFRQKFQVNEEFASQHYLGGLEHKGVVLLSGLLKEYDREKYAVELSTTRLDHHNNVLHFEGIVNLPRYKKVNVFKLDFQASGFKPLSALKDNLTFSTTLPLNEWLQDRLSKKKTLNDAAILDLLQKNPYAWLKQASPSIRYSGEGGGYLHWENDRDLVGESTGGHDTRDIYLKDTRFEVKSAHFDRQAATVTIELELTGANDVAISGVTSTLVVRSIHL